VVDAAFVTPDMVDPAPPRLLPVGCAIRSRRGCSTAGPSPPGRTFHYEIKGSSLADFEVVAASEA